MPTPKLESNGLFSIRICYKDAYGQKKQLYQGGFKKPNQAIVWADRTKAELEGSVDYKMSFFELCNYFIETKTAIGRAPKTIFSYRQNIEIIKKAIGNPDARKISTPMLQAIINATAGQKGKCEHLCSTMSALFGFAYSKKLISENPFHFVDKPSFEKTKKQSYSLEQYIKLRNLIKDTYPQFYAPILLMGSFGLRPGEAVAVEESDFDTILKALTISKSTVIVERLTKEDKRQICHGSTKTHAARVLPYNDALYQELHNYKQTESIESDYLCCYKNGKQMTSNALYQALKRISITHNLPKITPYSLRHTFGNICKRLGTDSFTTSKLMGHATERTTKENYYENDEVLNSAAMCKVLNAILEDKNCNKIATDN